MHEAQNVLSDKLKRAATEVRIGGIYSHYKRPTETYRVVNLAVTESDDEVCVVYEAQYGERLMFVRPLTSWLDTVERDGVPVDRFTLLE